MNKMKLRKVVLLIALAVCLLLFGVGTVLSIYYKDFAFVLEGLRFLAYAAFISLLIIKNKEIEDHCRVGAVLVLTIEKMNNELGRYRKMYGELPEEETKEEGTNEEKKEE